MKAIGIDAIFMDDDCNILEKKSTMIKALLDSNGDIVYTDVLELNTLQEIKDYPDLESFLELVINTAKTEFENKFNSFEISGIDENNEYMWNIKCISTDEDLFYSFGDLSSQHKIFTEDYILNTNEE